MFDYENWQQFLMETADDTVDNQYRAGGKNRLRHESVCDETEENMDDFTMFPM